MSGFLSTLGNIFMGPGAVGDPKEAFKLYAPPGLLSSVPEDQQELYGKQIQAQMRKINADYRPTYTQMQSGVLDSLKLGIAQQEAQRTRGDLSKIFGDPPAAPQAGVNGGVEVSPIDGNTPVDRPLQVDGTSPTSMPVRNTRKTNAMKYFQAAQYYAQRGDGDTAKKYHDIGISLDPNPSQEIRDLEYLGFNMAGTGDSGFNYIKQYNESKSPKTNVNVNSGIQKGEEAYWSTLGKNLPELESQAMAAARTNEALQSMIDLGNKKTFTGPLAPTAIGATQFLNSFGLNVKPETLANTREFQAQANILVLDFMGAMGGARGFSKEESAILYDAFPKIIDSPQARERIARMLMARNNRLIRDYNTMRGQFEGGIGKPLASPRISPSEPAVGAPDASAPRVPTYNPKTGKFE